MFFREHRCAWRMIRSWYCYYWYYTCTPQQRLTAPHPTSCHCVKATTTSAYIRTYIHAAQHNQPTYNTHARPRPCPQPTVHTSAYSSQPSPAQSSPVQSILSQSSSYLPRPSNPKCNPPRKAYLTHLSFQAIEPQTQPFPPSLTGHLGRIWMGMHAPAFPPRPSPIA